MRLLSALKPPGRHTENLETAGCESRRVHFQPHEESFPTRISFNRIHQRRVRPRRGYARAPAYECDESHNPTTNASTSRATSNVNTRLSLPLACGRPAAPSTEIAPDAIRNIHANAAARYGRTASTHSEAQDSP